MARRETDHLSRRDFVRGGLAGGATLWLGCGADGSPGGDSTEDGGGGTVDASTCGAPTASDIEGPFFIPDSPQRTDLSADAVGGTVVVIRGVARDVRCEPVANALLDFWQADAEGAYDAVGFMLRGHQYTDDDGRFELQTIVPGRYLNGDQYRPAHIHVKAQRPGGAILTTQLYFDDDPFNDVDPWFQQSMALAVMDGVAEFDFVLE